MEKSNFGKQWASWGLGKKISFLSGVSFVFGLLFLALGLAFGRLSIDSTSYSKMIGLLLRMTPAGIAVLIETILGSILLILSVIFIIIRKQWLYFINFATGLLSGVISANLVLLGGCLNGNNPEIYSLNQSAALALVLISAAFLLLSSILAFSAIALKAFKEEDAYKEDKPAF